MSMWDGSVVGVEKIGHNEKNTIKSMKSYKNYMKGRYIEYELVRKSSCKSVKENGRKEKIINTRSMQ